MKELLYGVVRYLTLFRNYRNRIIKIVIQALRLG